MIIKFLGLFFILFIIILVIGLTILSSVFRFLFKGRRNNLKQPYGQGYNMGTGQKQPTDEAASYQNEVSNDTHPKNKKVFGKDEGEYVDFEEIN